MIEAKGTKTKPSEGDASQRYVLKSMDKVSKTPLVLGMLLTGLALYLKSIFPGWTRPEEEQPTPEEDVRAGAAVPSMAPARPVAVPTEAAASDAAPPAEHGRGSSGTPATLQPSDRFSLAEPLRLDFLQPETPLSWEGPRPSPLPGRPANDNRGGGASGGGGNPGADDTGAPGGNTGGEPSPDDDIGPPEDDGDDSPPTGNRTPRVSGPVYLMDVVGCATLAISLADLLRNAQDPDGDVLSVKNLAVSSGRLVPSGEGWVFQGSPQLLGPVTVTYQITDGEFTIDQVAHFSVVRPPGIRGTDGDDTLLGSMCADEIDGAGGNDNIDGRSGDDVIDGESGDDHIVAGDDDDVVFGGDGDDLVFGGAGNDSLSGGSGDDRLFGQDGDDVIFGDGGDDRLSGGEGQDLLSGGDGADVAYGDAGDDTIEGGDGDDALFGSSGRDTVDGGTGDDRIEGGAGDDVLLDGEGEDVILGGDGDDHVMAALDSDDDVFDGGEDRDTLDYAGATDDLVIDLVSGLASGLEIGEDSISGFETLVGGQGDDHFIVGDKPVVLAGGGGGNLFEFCAPGPSAEASLAVHEILDFDVGDRIRMSKYDIFEEVIDELESQFERVYGDGIDDDDVALRYWHDRTDEMERTIIEADLNNDEIWETTITLQGHHALVTVENA